MASCSNKESSSAGHPGEIGDGGAPCSWHVPHNIGHISGTEKMPKAPGGKSQNAAMSGLAHSTGSSLPLQVGVDVVVVAVFVVLVVDVLVVSVDAVVAAVVVVVVFVPVAVMRVLVRVVVAVVVVATQLLHMAGHPSFTARISHRLAPSSTQLEGSRLPLQNGDTVVTVVEVVVHVLHSTGQSA